MPCECAKCGKMVDALPIHRCVLWKVQVFDGDEPYEDAPIEEIEFEVSVIRLDNKHGQDSWGWGDDNKIILDVDTREFGLKVAHILCEQLNRR